jgi:ribonucleotide reductase beta subunit family protein with ferritin-like domain
MFQVTDRDNRLYYKPIYRQTLHDKYITATKLMWFPDEISYAKDTFDYEELSNECKHVLKYILSFFASIDTLINNNIIERFMNEVPYQEAKRFYQFTVAIENIHTETYLDQILKVIPEEEHNNIFDSTSHYPVVDKLKKWVTDCTVSNETIDIRLLRIIFSEGIFFQGAFAFIFWLKSRNLLPGIAFSNELISRDEALHTEFGIILYNMLLTKPSFDIVKPIFLDAMNIAETFIIDILPIDLEYMNANLMKRYLHNIADNILIACGYKSYYGDDNPFAFMKSLNMDRKTDFFSKTVSEYTIYHNEQDNDDDQLI